MRNSITRKALGGALTLGLALAAVLAAIVRFAVLPGMETFVGLSLMMGCVLVPVGILSLQPWQTSVFKSFAILFFLRRRT